MIEYFEDAMVEDVKEALRSVIKKYLPLPTWENETINRAFSENGKADDDHRTAQS